MTLEEAKQIFNITTLTVDLNLKKMYKNLIFLNHPDAHPNEEQEYFKAKIQEITEAYSILSHSIEFLKSDGVSSQEEEYKKNKQIKKEQILTEIVVKSYYQSQNEISQLKAEILNQYINRVSSLDINREKMMGSILKPITIEVAQQEAKIMEKIC